MTIIKGFGSGLGALCLALAIGAALSLIALGEPPMPLFWTALAIMAMGTVAVTQDSLKA